MCATFELILKKKNLQHQDIEHVESLFQANGFLVGVDYAEKRVQEAREHQAIMEQMKREEPHLYQNWLMMMEGQDPREEWGLTEQDNEVLYVSGEGYQKGCLCGFRDTEVLLSLLSQLVESFDEVHYGPSGDVDMRRDKFSWESSQVKSLSQDRDTFHWMPRMGWVVPVQVIQ